MKASSASISALFVLAMAMTGSTVVHAADHNHLPSNGLRGGARRARQEADDQLLFCRITCIDTMYGNSMMGTQETVCIPIYDNQESRTMMLSITLPQDIADTYAQDIAGGQLFVSIDGARIIRGDRIALAHDAKVTVQQGGGGRNLVLQQPVIGTRSILIVRVSTSDASPDFTLAQMRARIFAQNAVSVKSQFEACSFGKLKFQDAGGLNIQLNHPKTYFDDVNDLTSVAIEKIQQNSNNREKYDSADHVMFCMPAILNDWIALGAVNHRNTMFRNEFCLSLSAVMHEIGHNLGLLHSGKPENMYADQSGYMGYSQAGQYGPRKCYNGLKSWQLGWYASRQKKANPWTPSKIKLATFVDFKKTKSTEPVVLHIGDRYYLQYNRRKGINNGSIDKGDKVTVTRDMGTRSSSLAGLGVGDRWTVDNYKGSGKKLIVEVCRKVVGTSTTPDAMVLSVALGQSYCNKDVPGAPAPIYINAGGPASNFRGVMYESDAPYASGGKTYSTDAQIQGTEKDFLYKSERFGDFKYTFDDLPSGDYTVNLYFAEIRGGITSPGQRLFDVYVQGQLFLNDYDVFAKSGGRYRAHLRKTQARVSSDGRLVIGIRNGPAREAKISGIDILPL